MISHYLKVAGRRLRRSPSSAVVNVLTLALGLTCFVAASAVVDFWDRAEQHFANADRTYVVTSVSWAGLVVPGTNEFLAERLETDFAEIEATARVTLLDEALRASSGGRSARLATYSADAEFLDIFDLPFIAGDFENALGAPRSVILTRGAAQRLVGAENALGRPVLIDGIHEATVTGVIDEIPEPSHMGRSASAMLRFDMLTSRDLHATVSAARGSGSGLPRLGSAWVSQQHVTYVLLPANGSLSAARLREQLGPFVRRHVPPELLSEYVPELELDLMPVTELLAEAANETVFLREAGVSAPAVLLGLGTLLLLIACVNYANLATARAALRGREVGVRKTLGATRTQLITQHLLDAALHTLVALLLAVLAVRAIAPFLDDMLGIDVGLSLLADFRSYALLAGLVVAVTAIAGIYPALVLSSVQPVAAIRAGVSPFGPRGLVNVLTGAQFAAASFLLVAVGVIFLQHRALESAVPAAGDDPLLIIENDPAETQVGQQTLRNELLALQQVRAATTAAFAPWAGRGAGAPPPVGRTPDGSTAPRPVRMYRIGDDFFSTLGIPVLAGRVFEPGAGGGPMPSGDPDQPLPIVVDRDLSERLGFSSPEQAVGEIVYWLWGELEPGGDGPATPLEILGVVENRRLNIATGLGPASSIYSASPTPLPVHLVRITGSDIAGALEAVDGLWQRLAPSVPLDRRFVADELEESFERYARIGRAVAMLALFAFLISTFGLLGMALLLASRRVHEIAVRKTLGARKAQMMGMLLFSLTRPVAIANVVALPFGFAFGQAYLQTFDQPIALTPWPFVFSLGFTLAVAWIAVGQQAWRAARVNPSDVLRRE